MSAEKYLECPECKGSGEADRIEHDSVPCGACNGKGSADKYLERKEINQDFLELQRRLDLHDEALTNIEKRTRSIEWREWSVFFTLVFIGLALLTGKGS
jgi:uncharacterized membrane protein YvbJ